MVCKNNKGDTLEELVLGVYESPLLLSPGLIFFCCSSNLAPSLGFVVSAKRAGAVITAQKLCTGGRFLQPGFESCGDLSRTNLVISLHASLILS